MLRYSYDADTDTDTDADADAVYLAPELTLPP